MPKVRYLLYAHKMGTFFCCVFSGSEGRPWAPGSHAPRPKTHGILSNAPQAKLASMTSADQEAMEVMRAQISELQGERDALLAQSASPTEGSSQRLEALEKALAVERMRQ